MGMLPLQAAPDFSWGEVMLSIGLRFAGVFIVLGAVQAGLYLSGVLVPKLVDACRRRSSKES